MENKYNKVTLLDKKARILSSILFRGVMIIYALFIIFFTKKNYFYPINYTVGFFLYITLYIIFFPKLKNSSKNKNKLRSFIRMVSDYLFIIFILYGKDINNIVFTLFFLFPIFNSPNHSDPKRSTIATFSLAVLSYLFLAPKELTNIYINESIKIAFAFTLLAALDYSEQFRSRLIMFTNSTFTLIDKFYEKQIQSYKIHKIYQEFIKEVNKSNISFLIIGNKIETMYCFKLKHNVLSLINGSELVYDFFITLDEQDLINLKNDSIIKNIECVINNNQYKYSRLIPVKDDKDIYIFYISFKENLYDFFDYFNVGVKPLLVKIVNAVKLENELIITKNEEFKKIKSKLNYVNNATSAMHFLRNKFSPITNFMEMLKDYELFIDLCISP